jgi:hypothetical protein
MKKAMLFRALVTASVLICSPQVMAQEATLSAEALAPTISFEQLKIWLFTARSNSARIAEPVRVLDASPANDSSHDRAGQSNYIKSSDKLPHTTSGYKGGPGCTGRSCPPASAAVQ